MTRGVRAGIRRLFRLAPARPEQRDEEIEDQIRLHIDLRTEQLIARGVPREEARIEALRRFGPVEEVRERLRESARQREHHMQIREMLDAIRYDLRFAIRGLARQPAFTAAVIFTLALGIGANATMFAIADRLLFRPPAHLRDPGQTARVFLFRTLDGEERIENNISYPRYLDISATTTSFSQTVAHFTTEMVIGLGDDARQRQVTMASASYWPFFGARPALGRFFTPEEDVPPVGAKVAVLTDAHWRTAFGGDSAVLGKPIHIGRNAYTIIGVAPRDFNGLGLSAVAAFIPISAGGSDLFAPRPNRPPWHRSHNYTWMEMAVRRKPGVTVEAANADLTRAYRRSIEKQRAETPSANAIPFEELRPRGEAASIIFDRGPRPRQNTRVATWLGGVSILVLLLACANVASLLLARAMQRRREIAVRIALGVSRARLIRSLLTESLLLAIVGGLAALAVAAWGGRAITSLLLADVAWAGSVVDGRVLLFTAVAATFTGLVTGLLPAMQLTRPDIAVTLKGGGREGSAGRTRLRASLIAAQGAITVLLLVGAGLFVRSLHEARSLDLGYDPDRVALVSIELRGTELDSAQRVALVDRVEAHAKTLPWVENAAETVSIPFWRTWSEELRVPGVDSSRLRTEFVMNAVSPGYFATLGTRILRGRGFEDADRAGSMRVAVISAEAERSIWDGADGLGRCIKAGSDTAPCITVIGIAANTRRSFSDGPAADVFYPSTQSYFAGAAVYVRTRGPARLQLDATRRALQSLMPGMAYVDVRSLESIVEPNIRPWQLGATMFTLFGVLALIVAAVGLYSVISYNVTQRMHELGVRVALGARRPDLVRLVVGEGVRIIALGTVIGVLIALLAGRFVSDLLYGVSERDPVTFVAVIATLLTVAAAASMLPALRASRADPNVALRAE